MDRNRMLQRWHRAVDWLGARKPIEVIALMLVPIAIGGMWLR
jgi:hypothetical protein